jgi:hypothetical protein
MVRALVVATLLAAAPAPPGGIERAAWLHGCWEARANGRTVEEQWMAPRGGSMIGVSRTVRDGELVTYELVILRAKGERLEYEAHPAGQPSAAFISRTIGDSELVFENPAHDFPQEIGYRRRGDELAAWIAGPVKGEPRRQEIPYKRVACEAR